MKPTCGYFFPDGSRCQAPARGQTRRCQHHQVDRAKARQAKARRMGELRRIWTAYENLEAIAEDWKPMREYDEQLQRFVAAGYIDTRLAGLFRYGYQVRRMLLKKSAR